MQPKFTSIYTFTLTKDRKQAFRFTSKGEASRILDIIGDSAMRFNLFRLRTGATTYYWLLKDGDIYIQSYKFEFSSCIQNPDMR